MVGLMTAGCPVAHMIAHMTVADEVLLSHLHGETHCTIDASSNVACCRLVAGITGAVAGSRILFKMPA